MDVAEREREELWMESVRRYNAARDARLRSDWAEYHRGQAARLRSTVGPLIAFHEGEARGCTGGSPVSGGGA